MPQDLQKVQQSLENLYNALGRLEEALAEKSASSLVIDGTIQRYEFTLELLWKTIKRFMDFEGISASSPREVMQKAYAMGWFDNEAIWLDMLRDRNLTSHVYDEDMANRIYNRIHSYYPALNQAYDFLEERFNKLAK